MYKTHLLLFLTTFTFSNCAGQEKVELIKNEATVYKIINLKNVTEAEINADKLLAKHLNKIGKYNFKIISEDGGISIFVLSVDNPAKPIEKFNFDNKRWESV